MSAKNEKVDPETEAAIINLSGNDMARKDNLFSDNNHDEVSSVSSLQSFNEASLEKYSAERSEFETILEPLIELKEGSSEPINEPAVEPSAMICPYTKKGLLRKRRVFLESQSDRKRLKLEKKRRNHSLKTPCPVSCKKRCCIKIGLDHQTAINDAFWKLTTEDQKWFIFKYTSKSSTKQKRTLKLDSRRKFSFTYTLPNENDEDVDVCKQFFLATLGYEKQNDRVVRNVISNSHNFTPEDKRGRHTPSNKMDHSAIEQHIKDYLSQYTDAHATKQKCLPGNTSVMQMYKNFLDTHKDKVLSYCLYRKIFARLDFSFAKLEGEENC